MKAAYSSIRSEVESFITTAIEQTRPDWVIVVDRKGTALLRFVLEGKVLPPRSRGWSGWNQVRTQEAIKGLKPEGATGKRFLLVEDTIDSGESVREILELLVKEKQVDRANITVASFCVHKNSNVDVDYRWCGEAGDRPYREIHQALLGLFQERGSLLLDTEHVEVPVQLLDCGRREFFSALSMAGLSVEHTSEVGRVNLTVYNPVIIDEKKFKESLPNGTITTNCVRKIRVVEREDNRYAVIPIFFPAIPIEAKSSDLLNLDEPIRKLAVDDDPKRLFRLVGMFAAIELLRTVAAVLHELKRANRIRVDNPMPGGPGDAISHLLAMFPDLDLASVHTSIQRRLDWSHVRKRDLCDPMLIDAGWGTTHAHRLHVYRGQVLKLASEYAMNHYKGPAGATLEELIHSRVTDPMEQALMSAAIDQCIDAGQLHASTVDLLFRDGRWRKTRAFKLDNEMVAKEILLANALYGFIPSFVIDHKDVPSEKTLQTGMV